MTERAFFYVFNNPSLGMWIDIEGMDEDDVKRELADGGFIPCDDDDDPIYEGELLVEATEGDLAPRFHSSGLSGNYTFNLDGFNECLSDCDRHRIEYEAAAAYLENCGSWSLRDFQNLYYGRFDSERKFAEQYASETMDIPEYLQNYIDYDALAKDLFTDSFYYDDNTGHVFRST